MIIRSGKARLHIATAEQAERHGMYSSARLSEDGGLKQFGAYLETLEPGSRSSERHWHEQEDEFLYLLSGEATVIEDDGEHFAPPRRRRLLAGRHCKRTPGREPITRALLVSHRGYTSQPRRVPLPGQWKNSVHAR